MSEVCRGGGGVWLITILPTTLVKPNNDNDDDDTDDDDYDDDNFVRHCSVKRPVS